jgi:hypothetical protein
LPVELISLIAEKQNEHSLVTWKTASELNNSHFEVEHSTDGTRFRKVGEVLGTGTTLQYQLYDFLHVNPEKGNNYYRLKQVDFDRNFEYSPVITVNFETEASSPSIQVNIYPNPTTDILNIESSNSLEQNTKYSIYNTLGQSVISNQLLNASGLVQINVQSLPSGTYFLRVDGMEEAVRFIKK